MKKTSQVAFCGIVCALAVVIMLLTGIFPFAEYALPALAGLVLISIVFEYGFRAAVLGYVVVAVLAGILAPNKEAAVFFITFLGYYPLLKGRLESTVKNRVWEWVWKLVSFNFAVLLAYFLLIVVMGMTELMGEIMLWKYGVAILLLLANAVFVIYDIAITRVIGFYLQRIRPKIRRGM